MSRGSGRRIPESMGLPLVLAKKHRLGSGDRGRSRAVVPTPPHCYDTSSASTARRSARHAGVRAAVEPCRPIVPAASTRLARLAIWTSSTDPDPCNRTRGPSSD